MKFGTAHLFGLAIAAASSTAIAADYQGSEVDGQQYNCTAFSYQTAKYYYLTCEFSGSEVILYFPKGGHISVSMDDEEIDDPSSISAFDYTKGTYWDLDVDID
jgi:hypothetical protein